jgi:dipeptidyl aminopeptidase/acylaminoacyl peptidase
VVVSKTIGSVALAAIVSLSAGAAGAAPLEAYGRLPALEQMAVSPQGDKLAFITDLKGQRTVIVQSLRPTKLIAGAAAGQQKLRSLDWADDDHVLITISKTDTVPDLIGPRQEWFVTESYDIAHHRFSPLIDRVEQAMNVTAGAPEFRKVDGKATVFVRGIYFPDQQGVRALFQVDVASGRGKLVAGGSRDAEDWVVDDQGHVVAETDYSEKGQRWSLRLKRGAGWREALGEDAPIDTPDVEGISPDGSGLFVRTYADGKEDLRQLSLADGAMGPSIEADHHYDRPLEDPITHRVIGGEKITTRTEYRFFDPKDQAQWDKIQRAFPGEDVALESWTDDRKLVIARVTGPRYGVVYVAVDLNTNRADVVGQIYEGLGSDDIAPVQTITYAAADGRKIPAYLTLPKGKDPKGLPLVVLPHGGPAARDDPGFDWWSQALASRGYAVLQPQFRGSDGFGSDLLAAGYGQWGRKMQSDLSDGVRDLAAKGTIDPKRVCIVGASYGGYAALAGITLDAGVYRCAVSVAGLADLHRFLAWRRSRQGYSKSRVLRYWDRFMGASSPDDPILDQISPVKHLDKASAPLLLIHGKDDTVVPFEQSQIMADAMKKAGKSVEFVTLEGEDHWLSRSETRLQMLQATVKFLEANNPPS